MPDETWSKLDAKAKECRLIRYEGDSIYVVVDVSKKKLHSHNVIFIEGTGTHTDSTKPKSMEFQSVKTLRQTKMMVGVFTWLVTMRPPSNGPDLRYG